MTFGDIRWTSGCTKKFILLRDDVESSNSYNMAYLNVNSLLFALNMFSTALRGTSLVFVFVNS